eukprot:970936-Pelagomonas_calceolata.AAC.1
MPSVPIKEGLACSVPIPDGQHKCASSTPPPLRCNWPGGSADRSGAKLAFMTHCWPGGSADRSGAKLAFMTHCCVFVATQSL